MVSRDFSSHIQSRNPNRSQQTCIDFARITRNFKDRSLVCNGPRPGVFDMYIRLLRFIKHAIDVLTAVPLSQFTAFDWWSWKMVTPCLLKMQSCGDGLGARNCTACLTPWQ